jgi:WD40 repeat protein
MTLTRASLAAQKPELIVQSGHSDTVVDLAFSPDSKILASGGSDNIVKLWDLSSGKELRSLNGVRDGSFVAFSSDGRILAPPQWNLWAKRPPPRLDVKRPDTISGT